VTTVNELCSIIEQTWPAAGAESWDSIGLVVGHRRNTVTHVRLCVDVTPDVIADAHAAGADFLIAHHPLLLRGVTSIDEETYKGNSVALLIRHRIGLLTAHTNADVVSRGVSDSLARALELTDVEPIVAHPHSVGHSGIGRVGNLVTPTPLGVVARRIATILPATAAGVRVSGEYERLVSRVALCGGAGDSLLSEPQVRTADAYITSDLRHHPASEFREWAKSENGPALVDVSHWASEWVWLATAAHDLTERMPSVVFSVSDVRTDPWDFLVVQ